MLQSSSHQKPTGGDAYSINLLSEVREHVCFTHSRASWLWLHGCECCAYVLFITRLHTCLHQVWTFLCARLLPKTNKKRIRFDWCKSLIWLLLVMQACTQQLLCDNLIFLYVLVRQIFYCIIMRRNCVGSYRFRLDPRQWSVAIIGYGLSRSITHWRTKSNFVFYPCTYRVFMPLALTTLCTCH